MFIQFILSLFLLFAISRVVLQVKSGKLTSGSFLFWSGLFVFALVGVLEPEITSYVARWIGIGRGADIVIYISIALLFYLIFRLSIAIEDIKREITQVVRRVTLDEHRQVNAEKSQESKKRRQ